MPAAKGTRYFAAKSAAVSDPTLARAEVTSVRSASRLGERVNATGLPGSSCRLPPGPGVPPFDASLLQPRASPQRQPSQITVWVFMGRSFETAVCHESPGLTRRVNG